MPQVRAPRPGARCIVPLAGALALALTGCSGGGSSPASSNATAASPTTSAAAGATATNGGGSVPTSLDIPSINFHKKVAGIGLAPNGELSPPPGVTQWYNATVSPGKPGISVIAGHVTYNGKADVFDKLEEVKVKDTFTIGYADGSHRQFVVTREKSVDKNALQKDQTVWGPSKTPVVTLITCDGRSKVVGAHHVNNFVVWAVPQ